MGYCPEQNLCETIFLVELPGNFEYIDCSPQVGRNSSPSCVSVQGILLSPHQEQPTCTHAVLSFLAGKVHVTKARKGEIRRGSPETQQFVCSSQCQAGLHSTDIFWLLFNTSDCSPPWCFLRLMYVGAVLLKSWSVHHLQTF